MLRAKGLSVDPPGRPVYIVAMDEKGGRSAERDFAILGVSIGKTIERLRERKGLTQEDLVMRLRSGPGSLSLHSSGLSKIENGHRMPRSHEIYAICLALEMDMPQFWTREARVRRELLEDI